MTFIILGAGAIGCYVGGRLAAAGQHLSLVGRPRIIEALSRHGLRVSDQSGFDTSVPPDNLHLATSLSDALRSRGGAPHDPFVLLVCTKATGTATAAAEIGLACPAGTVVVSLQNGVENAARLQAGAPKCKVLAGMVPFTVNWRNTHHVYQANAGCLQILRSADSESFAQTLRAAGLGAELHDDMQGILWGKLLLNLLNPINALANLPIHAQLMQRDHRRVFAALQDEALAVLKAAHIQPAKVAAAAPHVVPKVLRLPDWLFTRVAKGMLKTESAARTSMCDDLQNGRPTEIDDLCGAVLRLATKHGMKAPLNQAVLELVANYRKGQDWSGSRLRVELGL